MTAKASTTLAHQTVPREGTARFPTYRPYADILGRMKAAHGTKHVNKSITRLTELHTFIAPSSTIKTKKKQLTTFLHDGLNSRKLKTPLNAQSLRLTILCRHHSCHEITLLLRDRRVSRYKICYLFVTIRRSCTCRLKSVEDLTRMGINVSSTFNTMSFACVPCSPCGPCVGENM